MAQRSIIVGDIHGCIDELWSLLRACDYDSTCDRLISVGDLVAKGPASHEVLALCRELGAEAVLGNHDYALLSHHRASSAAVGRPQKPGHAAVAARLTREDWEYLEAMPLWLTLPEYGSLVVHGGFVPGVPLEEQAPETLMNIRTLTDNGEPSSRADAGELWGRYYDGPPFVYFGHHALAGLQQHAWAWGLDTGCVYGHRLTACTLPEQRLVSVPARRAYREVD